jgi:glycosyltransferase involved in cell wall biosynthesis
MVKSGTAGRLTVGYNLVALHPRMAGMRTYSTGMLGAILAETADVGWRHVVFTTSAGLAVLRAAGLSDALGDTTRITLIELPLGWAGKPGALLLEQFVLPMLARSHAVDVLHSFDYSVPLMSGRKLTVTLHDLQYLRNPGFMRAGQRILRAVLVPAGLRRANEILAVSPHTASDVRKYFDVGGRPISIAANAPAAWVQTALRSPGSGGRHRAAPYVLSVGTGNRQKNYPRLVEAFAAMQRRDVSLVIAGRPGADTPLLLERARTLGVFDRVVLAGFCSDAELADLYRGALAVIVPSVHEGFGIPVLEAMAFDVPVASSNAGALADVAGDAALLFDPFDIAAMTRALDDIVGDSALREKLRARGQARSASYSWSASGRVLRDLIVRMAT